MGAPDIPRAQPPRSTMEFAACKLSIEYCEGGELRG